MNIKKSFFYRIVTNIASDDTYNTRRSNVTQSDIPQPTSKPTQTDKSHYIPPEGASPPGLELLLPTLALSINILTYALNPRRPAFDSPARRGWGAVGRGF